MRILQKGIVLGMALGILLSTLGCEKSMTLRYSGGPTGNSPEALALASSSEGSFQETGYYTYNYFPSSQVYYDNNRKLYFYTNGEEWMDTHSLPSGITLDQSEAVSVKLEHPVPYTNPVN